MHNQFVINTDSVRTNIILADLATLAAQHQHHLMNTLYCERSQLQAAELYHFYRGAAAYYEAKLIRNKALRKSAELVAASEWRSWQELKALNAK